MNKQVARFADGRILKGTTLDFSPAKEFFHLTLPSETLSIPVHLPDLKALFFVKDFAGDPEHVEKKNIDTPVPPGARAIRATFDDGEVLVGTTTGYRHGFPGFFLVPADSESNNERCYIVADATQDVRFL